MSRTSLRVPSMLMLGMAAVFLGCSRQPPVTEPPPLEVVVSQAKGKEPDLIKDWDSYTGTVSAKEDVEVRSRVKGHILETPFSEGEEVEAGKVLFVIDSDPFKADLEQAKGQLAKADAKLKLAEEKIALYTPLVKEGTVSKDDLFKVTGDKGEAIGEIDSAKAKIREAELNIGFCTIKAPIAGKVGEALLTKGDLVNASGTESLLTTIVAVDPMYVYFDINEVAYQRYRDQVRKDPELSKMAKPKIPIQLEVSGKTKPYKGEVDFVDNRVNPATASIKIRARFDNKPEEDGKRPLTVGLFAKIRVSIGKERPALLVSDRAILTDQNLKYVLVVNKDNVVERVDIDASERLQDDGRREVISGLKGDEWIIVEGVNRVRPGVTVSPKQGPMPHRPKAAE